jgi:hypothetical protein
MAGPYWVRFCPRALTSGLGSLVAMATLMGSGALAPPLDLAVRLLLFMLPLLWAVEVDPVRAFFCACGGGAHGEQHQGVARKTNCTCVQQPRHFVQNASTRCANWRCTRAACGSWQVAECKSRHGHGVSCLSLPFQNVFACSMPCKNTATRFAWCVGRQTAYTDAQ